MAMMRILIISVLLVLRAQADCFYPDGSVSPQDTPCNDVTENATCCGQGYACLSNNICMATGDELQKSGATKYVRGSCTDKTWRSSDCPLFCLDPQADDTAGGEGIGECPGTDKLFYCIDGTDVDCSKEQGVLVFEQSPTVLTTIGVAASTTTTSTTSSTSSTSSTSTTSTTASSPTTQSGPSSSANQAATQQNHHSSSLSEGSAVGIGVGVGVGGALVLAIVAFLLFRRYRRRQREVREATTDSNRDLPPDYRYQQPMSQYSEAYDSRVFGQNSHQENYAPKPNNNVYEAPTQYDGAHEMPAS